MDEIFIPRTDLEQKLADLYAGSLTEEAFLEALVSDEVFMPIEDDTVGGVQRSLNAVPLVIEAEGGVPVLFVFTSPERAKPIMADFPGFGGGLLTEFKWLLERVEEGSGIALNPGWETGYDLEPELVARLRTQLAGH